MAFMMLIFSSCLRHDRDGLAEEARYVRALWLQMRGSRSTPVSGGYCATRPSSVRRASLGDKSTVLTCSGSYARNLRNPICFRSAVQES
jgi:hypothetical protein